VAVTVVCPGLVATALAEHLGLPDGDEAERERLSELLRRRGCPPERVAQAILRACERRPALVTVGADAAIVRFFGRWLPTLLPVLASRVGPRRTVRDMK
jgi:short-subunit dehydrogenase